VLGCKFGGCQPVINMPSPVQVPAGRSAVLVGSAITVSVVSADLKLVALCRDVLRELGETARSLEIRSDAETIGNSKVCLWDCESAQSRPSLKQSGSTRIFYLVAPSRVESLLRSAPTAEGHILLKPVTRAVLRTFLQSALPSGEHDGPTLGTLRANRDDLLQRLLHANLRLQEYDQQRTNFIARAVHDFRAPLTALSGFCGLLASGHLGPLNNEQKEALNRMEHSAKRISRMACAMFDLSIGARVNSKADLREGDIRERIKQTLHEILPLASEKEISLKAEDITSPGQPLYFESSQIEQVLLNLLDNACKFTHRGGTIEVLGYPFFWERRFLVGGSAAKERRVENIRSPNSYRIDIKDTGPGIPADRMNHIFEEYTSYAGPQDRSGGGLGLAICRLIMSRHEGHIWADSYEGGAIFSFVLPYRRAELRSGVA
jgi:signal transduction histidine kinase